MIKIIGHWQVLGYILPALFGVILKCIHKKALKLEGYWNYYLIVPNAQRAGALVSLFNPCTQGDNHL